MYGGYWDYIFLILLFHYLFVHIFSIWGGGLRVSQLRKITSSSSIRALDWLILPRITFSMSNFLSWNLVLTSSMIISTGVLIISHAISLWKFFISNRGLKLTFWLLCKHWDWSWILCNICYMFRHILGLCFSVYLYSTDKRTLSYSILQLPASFLGQDSSSSCMLCFVDHWIPPYLW